MTSDNRVLTEIGTYIQKRIEESKKLQYSDLTANKAVEYELNKIQAELQQLHLKEVNERIKQLIDH